MAAQQHRGALITQLLQHLPDGSSTLDIQPHSGLIQHQHLGPVQQPGGQIQAAAHTPGIGAAATINPVAHG